MVRPGRWRQLEQLFDSVQCLLQLVEANTRGATTCVGARERAAQQLHFVADPCHGSFVTLGSIESLLAGLR